MPAQIRGIPVKTYDKILVVDDDDVLRESMVNILENEGYIIDVAKSGYEAEMKLLNQVYNLVLLDIRLPDTTGIQLLSKINKYAPRMKKIVLTGFPDTDTAIKSVNEKADAYLVKPFDPEELLIVIADNLRQQKEEIKYTQEKVLEYIRNRVREIDNQYPFKKVETQ
ncbi:response regulator [Candidatus Bathyarchaeota archaeon]|nr:MAG: response regulator [Candidatus Bathyarchaeota archaeon]